MTQAKISEEMLNKNFKGMTIEIYLIAFLVIYPSKIVIESPSFFDINICYLRKILIIL